MKINKELLPMKAHYFLRYAGAAPLIYLLPLIVRRKGFSAQTVGLFWSVLPIMGLISISISGTLADYFKAHRAVFVMSLVSLTTGIASVYWIPDLPLAAQDSEGRHSLGPLVNATLDFRSLPDGNSSALGLGVVGVDPDMVVNGFQAATLDPLNVEEVEAESKDLVALLQYPQFWLVVLALTLERVGVNTCIMIADAVCFKFLGSERHKYGQQRLWGTVGMGLMAVASGALVDVYSQGLPQKDYLPAVIICIVMMVADVLVVARMRIPYSEGEKLNFGDVGSTLLNPQVFFFLVTVYVMGASLGMVWVFKLMMVEDVALDWDSEFPALKLLQGLVICMETFFGEVPFFFLSGVILARVGYTPVLSASVMATGLRCCLYYTVANPWWFLPIELLNGPSYSLFHTAMTTYASHLASPGAQATLQSIVRATFTTGLSTAGLVGGVLYNAVGGSTAFLHTGIFDLAYVLVFVFLQFLTTKYCSRDKMADKSSCMTRQYMEKADPSADQAPEVVQQLLLEKYCGGPTGTVASPCEAKGDEDVKFIV